MAVPKPKKYIEEFEKLGFGMFVHWGLYSQVGKGEWYFKQHLKLNKEEYCKLFHTFAASEFDAEQLVLTAKNAGCRYIVLTTRHHDGFSLYDTFGLCDFDAPHSPARRDLVKEYVEACNKNGVVPFFYHTTLDWYNPDFESDFDAYIDYLCKSVEILCRNYGKIGGFWFDGNWSKPDADWKEDKLYGIIRKYQPEAMIINNTGLWKKGEKGNIEIDSVTFEQGRPTPLNREGMEKYLAAEMCYTMNEHWGRGYSDFNYKSPSDLIESLCMCRRVGANFLLNIGPDADGKPEPMQAALMDVMGRWMRLYGEAIYNGKPCEIKGHGKNFALNGEGRIYIFVFELGKVGDKNVMVGGKYSGPMAFSGVDAEIKSVKWMDNGESLNFYQCGDILTIDATPYPDGMSAVVRVACAEI